MHFDQVTANGVDSNAWTATGRRKISALQIADKVLV